MIGLLASVIGLFAGLGLAVGLNELFVALNLDLPQTETVFATRTIVVSLLVGTAGHAGRRALAGLACDACAADRRRPGGREAAALGALALLALHRGRDRRAGRARALVRDARARRGHRRPVHPARRRRPGAVHRRGPALVAPRRPARPPRGVAGTPDRRRRREARRGQRDARPGAHRLDRGRAHDRDRARDVRRRARAGPPRLEQRRDRGADPGRPGRDLAGRLYGVPGRGRRRGRGDRGHRGRQQRAPGRRGGGRRGSQPDRPRRELDQPGLRLPLDGGLGRGAGEPGRRRSGRAGRRRRRQGPRGRRLVQRADARTTSEQEFVVRGIYDGSPFYPLLGTASVSQDRLRRALRPAAQPLHADQRPRRPGRRRRRRRSRAASRASPTRASRLGRSGSTRRTRRSASSCCCCTSCSRCRWSSACSA